MNTVDTTKALNALINIVVAFNSGLQMADPDKLVQEALEALENAITHTERNGYCCRETPRAAINALGDALSESRGGWVTAHRMLRENADLKRKVKEWSAESIERGGEIDDLKCRLEGAHAVNCHCGPFKRMPDAPDGTMQLEYCKHSQIDPRCIALREGK